MNFLDDLQTHLNRIDEVIGLTFFNVRPLVVKETEQQ